MRFAIYHPQDSKLNHSFNEEGMHYNKVAEVEADTLEEAFIRSQNAFDNKYAALGIRSTSVGDIIQPADGLPQMVMGTGFMPVPDFMIPGSIRFTDN